jgi:hypothetical protein
MEGTVSQPRRAALVSPVVDFVMLGGLSLLILPLSRLSVWESEVPKAHVGTVVFYLLFALNLPHFIHGYQLLYPNYWQKVRDAEAPRSARLRYVIAGIVAPVCLVAFLLYGTLQPTHTEIAYAANAVLFLTGWHYVKQGYGVLMTLSARQKIRYSDAGRRLLLINAYVAWVFSWIQYNTTFGHDVFYGVPYDLFPLPDEVNAAIKLVFFAWTLFAVILFVLHDGRRQGASFNGMLAYLSSVYVWVVFANANYLTLLLVPALHSLQYLLFVWKLKYEETREELVNSGRLTAVSDRAAKMAVLRAMSPFVGGAVTAGLAFYMMATQLDSAVAFRTEVFGPQYFMFCFSIFLNTHHYFIDFAIWRRDNPALRFLYR